MALLSQYDPPAHLSDFDAIPGQREAWHRYVQATMSGAVDSVTQVDGQPGSSPFYDPTTLDPGDTMALDVLWNAFPNELQRRFDRDGALAQAEACVPLSRFAPQGLNATPYSPRESCRGSTEYCEWQVDPGSGDKPMRRVTFTTEGPEYWQAMWGGPLPKDRVNLQQIDFPGSPEQVLRLYQSLVDPRVRMSDLQVQEPFNSPLGFLKRGTYNPYNEWNVRKGIVHLTAEPNQLVAEILLAAQATRCFEDESGRLVVQPEAICAGAGLGNVNRNSDIAILGCVNALARQGRRVTLANPVGLYIDHIDLSGWTVPGGCEPRDCVHIVRGGGNSITRLFVEVPDARFTLADIRIAGVPVTSGGQIAECITVRLRALASVARDMVTSRCPLTRSGYVQAGGRVVEQPAAGAAPLAAMVPAFGRSPGASLAATPLPCGCPK